MTVLTKNTFNSKPLEEHILSVINKSKKFLLFYFLIVIISSILIFINILPKESINVAIAILDFIALLLLYDSLKDILAFSKVLNDLTLLKKLTGILSSKDKRKDSFFIGKDLINKVPALDKNELRKHIDTKVEAYLVNNKILFLILN